MARFVDWEFRVLSLETFSELLEVLYSAPLDARQWERFLTLIVHHAGCRFGAFLCADSGRGLSVHSFAGDIDTDIIQNYNQRYAGTDPFRLGLLRQRQTGVFQGDAILSAEAFLQTDLYRECIMPAGARYVTLVPLFLSMRRLEAISLWRAPNDGPMDPDSVHLLEMLFPHLCQALEIHRVLDIAAHRVVGAEAMADSSATATFLLTRRGHVVHSNAAARRLLEREADALTLHEGALTAQEAHAKTRLRDLILSTALTPFSNVSERQNRALALSRDSATQPLQLIASPLPLERRKGGLAEVLLLITDPDKPSSCPDDVLSSLYNLTMSETEVANGILMGYTLEEIAALRRTKTSTVRNQVKSVLSKTGTARQSDLVRLLMSLPRSPDAS